MRQVVQLKKWHINKKIININKMPREWNTPHREKWNAPIHQILKAIDNHTHDYFKSGNVWHLHKADELRQYLHELKTWIHKNEGKL